jgi:hypothetical protein
LRNPIKQIPLNQSIIREEEDWFVRFSETASYCDFGGKSTYGGKLRGDRIKGSNQV